MPRRTDIHKILLIGSGPIVIGQACEFDYSGTQAARALRAEGYEVVLVNSNPATIIQITEDRQQFRDLMERIGIDQARSRAAHSLLEAKEIAQELGGLPIVIRPSFTLGGAGGGIVWTPEEFERKVTRGLEISPVHQVLIEECLFGWKEFELELLRDANDNVIIVCSIENIDRF